MEFHVTFTQSAAAALAGRSTATYTVPSANIRGFERALVHLKETGSVVSWTSNHSEGVSNAHAA